MPSQTIRDLMTEDPVTLSADTSLVDAARAMRDEDVGDVIVLKADGRGLCGMVTDRDIVIRAVAEGRDPSETKLDEVCSHEVISARPEDSVQNAVQIMREHSVRRLPVVDDNGSPVGVVSLGDLAVEVDPGSVLGEISAAEPNS